MEDIFVAAGCARRANSAVLPIIHWMLTLAMAILLLAPVSSHADPAFTATAGQPLVVVEASDPPLTVVDSPGGKAEVVANPKDNKKFDLLYTPDATNTVKTVAVRYSKGGQATAATIEVQPDKGLWGDAYGPVLHALFALFVLALLLEAALSLLFNWRVFLSLFDSRGAKTLFSFLGALWLVKAFELDIMARIMALLWNPEITSDWMTKILSSMVLAGGSSAVNSLMVALGFRSVRTAETITPKPPPTKAWLSIRLIRQGLPTEPVMVYLKSGPTGGYLGVFRFNGTDRRVKWLRWLMRDPLRFPAWGGFPVEPSVQYQVKLEGPPLPGGAPIVKELGPFTLAPGAILDIEETV
mgnify:CR=1 FL=1|jgi:hypothetical protein